MLIIWEDIIMFRGRKKSVDTSSTTSGGRRTSLDVISTTTGSSFRDSEGPTQGVFIVKWSDGSTSELVPTKIQQDQPVRGGSKQKRKALAKRDKTAVEDDVSSTDENEASFAARLKVKKFEVPKSPLRPKNSLETVTSMDAILMYQTV